MRLKHYVPSTKSRLEVQNARTFEGVVAERGPSGNVPLCRHTEIEEPHGALVCGFIAGYLGLPVGSRILCWVEKARGGQNCETVTEEEALFVDAV